MDEVAKKRLEDERKELRALLTQYANIRNNSMNEMPCVVPS
jgi:hypothetical protein